MRQDDELAITLSDVLDEQFKHVKFDKGFIQRAYGYQTGFINRDTEHLKFFGGNLIGVESIRFRTSDAIKFYRDVCDSDHALIERELKKVTTIVQEYKISSNALNLTLMYLIHRVLKSPFLTKEQRERGAYDLALIFFYCCIAIRQSEYFHFPADPKIAQAAYGELNKKFILKKLGTWAAVMDYRAKDLIDPQGLHRNKIAEFTDDESITYAISDSENRIRDMYKNYYKVFNKAYSEGSKIYSISSTITDAEGQEKIREKIKSTEQAINYIRSIVVDKDGFVKPELVRIITEINTNTSYRMLHSTVSWLSENYNDPHWHKKIDHFIKLIIVHSYHLLSEASATETHDYASVLILLKNLYLSTRSNDKELVEIRSVGDELIKAANGYVNRSLAMSTRTAAILYITLRTIMSKR